MNVRQLGHAGVSSGWRKQVADRVAPAVASSTRLEHDQVRALLGIAFFASSLYYVIRIVRQLAD
jgi:hypothetical protein